MNQPIVLLVVNMIGATVSSYLAAGGYAALAMLSLCAVIIGVATLILEDRR